MGKARIITLTRKAMLRKGPGEAQAAVSLPTRACDSGTSLFGPVSLGGEPTGQGLFCKRPACSRIIPRGCQPL